MKLENLHQDSSSSMQPLIMACILISILAMSTAVSFVGYHYLQLSSEYRQRNFIHLSQTNQAIEKLGLSFSTDREVIEQAQAHIRTARKQAFWCTNNLTTFETQMFEAAGAAPALSICRSNIAIAGHALIILDRIKHYPAAIDIEALEVFGMAQDARRLLREMHRESLEFHPYVNDIEIKVAAVVTAGTAITSTILFIVMLLLMWNLLRLLKRQAVQNQELSTANSRFAAAIEATTDGFALYDSDKRLLAWNKLYPKLVNGGKAEIQVGMTIQEVISTSVMAGIRSKIDIIDTGEFIREHMANIDTNLDNARIEQIGDLHVAVKLSHTKTGDYVIIRNDVTPFIRGHQKQAAQADELRRANAQIRHKSLHDPLTNLANRRYLDQELSRQMAQGPVGAIKMDLDHFKQVNDIFGHAAGDFVLQGVAKILEANTREGDLAARVGGDEFVILCQPGTSLEDAHSLGERLLKEVLKPVHYNGKLCYYGASLGVAFSDADTTTASELLRNADAALYEVKAAGRGAVQLFTPRLQNRLERERRLSEDFVTALEQREIVPFYQTQHDAGTRALAGVEALARWRHPELGLLAPDKFLTVVRQLGREADLDAEIFQRVLDETEQLENEAIELPRLAFNVSGARVIDSGFLQSVKQSLSRKRQRIAFEILESISIEELGERFIDSIDILKGLGCEIDIDDFGSYRASITSILDLKPDGLKVDRSIIRPLGQDPKAERLVSSIVEIGKALEITVTAEGVETEQQALMLEQIGCDKMQGYYFSKPMPIEGLRKFIHNNNRRVA